MINENLVRYRGVTNGDELSYGRIVDAQSGESILPVICVNRGRMAIDGLASILMEGFANREAVERTLEEERVVLWSPSRQELWTVGQTSGNALLVRGAYTNCTADSLLLDIASSGPICDAGTYSCFERQLRGRGWVKSRLLEMGAPGVNL